MDYLPVFHPLRNITMYILNHYISFEVARVLPYKNTDSNGVLSHLLTVKIMILTGVDRWRSICLWAGADSLRNAVVTTNVIRIIDRELI